MPNVIYTPTGEYIEIREDYDRAALTSELATAAAAGDLNVGSLLAWLPDPDPVLRRRGDDARVLEDLTADDQVCTACQARKMRVLNQRDYDYRPGLLPGRAATPEAERLCRELTQDLEDITLRNVFSAILDAPLFGYSVLELMWEAVDGKYRLRDIVAKPRHWFVFDKTGRPALKPATGGEPTPLPPGKFLVPRHFPTYENPYGLRLLSRCLWPVAFKRGGVRFFTRFLDRYGMPWPLGKAAPGSTDEQMRKMAADLAAMVQDAVAVVPHGAEVSFVESKGTGGAQFELYLKRWDKAIFKIIMGQTLTSEMDGQGSRAAAQVHMDVATDMAESDQYLIESTMNELAVIYRDLNAPGVQAPVFAYHEPEDYAAQAELDVKLYSVGVRFRPAHFERRYGLQPDEFTVAGGGEDQTGGATRYSEGPPRDHQEILDQLVETILPEAARQNETFIRDLLDLLERAESYEDVQVLLAEHLGLAQDEQEALLADLLAAAELMGRASVKDEADAS